MAEFTDFSKDSHDFASHGGTKRPTRERGARRRGRGHLNVGTFVDVDRPLAGLISVSYAVHDRLCVCVCACACLEVVPFTLYYLFVLDRASNLVYTATDVGL